ncbi:MAG: PRC-barrel domain-containing protein [Chloroflexota bacterium]|nr:PRC-barrel domain-containing protein [Chloroflexota bacterium]
MIDLGQVREGMEVVTRDGQSLGKVKEVWLGTDPSSSTQRCDEEICSRLEVQHGGILRRGERYYIPYSAIAVVAGGRVVLGVDEATLQTRGWARKPGWIGG